MSASRARSRAVDLGILKRILGGILPTSSPPPHPNVDGVAACEPPDEDEVYERALAEWRKTRELIRRRSSQHLRFESGPVCVVWLADLHLGGAGIDYPRVFEEAQIVADTPGMWAATVGDLVDQFILGRMAQERMETRLSIPDEWVLLRRYLRILGPKLLICVRGNHDGWIKALSGVDYFRDVVAEIAPDVLYNASDCRFRLEVGAHAWRVRVRHKWRGSSIYNPSHGIERAAKWDQNFDVGVGAHTHRGGFARGFSAGGRDCMAVMCGTYKRHDNYAEAQGFHAARRTTGVATIFHQGQVMGVEYLPLAAEIMTGELRNG